MSKVPALLASLACLALLGACPDDDHPETPDAGPPETDVTVAELGAYDFLYVAWSPDGAHIRAGTRKGASRRLLPLAGGVGAPGQLAVSPRGDELAFVSRSASAPGWRLELLDLHSGAIRDLGSVAAENARPTWSRDGGALAYLADTQTFLVVRPDDAGAPVAVAPVTDGPLECASADWSKDGTLLVSTVHEILAYDPATQGTTSVAPADGEVRYCNPRWSPDGTRVAYLLEILATSGYRRALEVRTLADGPVERLDELPSGPARPSLAWQPDGKGIVYIGRAPNDSGDLLFQIDVASHERQLLDELWSGGGLTWSTKNELLYVRFDFPSGQARLMIYDATSGQIVEPGEVGAGFDASWPAWLDAAHAAR